MRWAVFSDVHANLPALETFIRNTGREVDAYLCLGDVVNYGPWNDECLELIWTLPGLVFLEGNHERLFLGTEAVDRELPLVQAFYRYSFPLFSRLELISELPKRTIVGRYCCVHTINNKRVYPDSTVKVNKDVLIGHSHHQFRIRSGEHDVVNVGSVGQNRVRVDLVSYALLDDVSGEIKFRQDQYDAEVFINELVFRGYPRTCVDYYRKKLP